MPQPQWLGYFLLLPVVALGFLELAFFAAAKAGKIASPHPQQGQKDYDRRTYAVRHGFIAYVVNNCNGQRIFDANILFGFFAVFENSYLMHAIGERAGIYYIVFEPLVVYLNLDGVARARRADNDAAPRFDGVGWRRRCARSYDRTCYRASPTTARTAAIFDVNDYCLRLAGVVGRIPGAQYERIFAVLIFFGVQLETIGRGVVGGHPFVVNPECHSGNLNVVRCLARNGDGSLLVRVIGGACKAYRRRYGIACRGWWRRWRRVISA